MLIASHSISYREDVNGSFLQPSVFTKPLIKTGRQEEIEKENPSNFHS